MERPFAPGYRIPPDLLLKAYSTGVFPMAESADDPEVFWVRPEIRGIIPLDGFHVPKSLRKTLRKGHLAIDFDRDFDAVIAGCAEARQGRPSTWINAPIREAYAQLFERGHCHTVEARSGERLVGGLYGVTLGRTFFGESMFSREPDASKVCLVALVEHGSCFAGVLAELLWAVDRSYMMEDEFEGDNRPVATVTMSDANFGQYPMGNDLTRLETRFLGQARKFLERLRLPFYGSLARKLVGTIAIARPDPGIEHPTRRVEDGSVHIGVLIRQLRRQALGQNRHRRLARRVDALVGKG